MSAQTAVPRKLDEYKKAAGEKLKALSAPERSEESWRKVDLSAWQNTLFRPAESNAETICTVSDPGLRRINLHDGLNDPGIADELDRFLVEPGELAPTSPGTLYFDTLRRASANAGLCLHIQKSPMGPVLIRHGLTAGDTLAPMTFIKVDRGVELTIIEEIQGKPSDSFTQFLPETKIQVGDGATVRYVSLRRYAGSEFHFHRITAEQGRDSLLQASVVQLGGFCGKGFFSTSMKGPGSSFRGLGIAVGSGAEFQDIEFLVRHLADHTTSRILYKTVLRDRAHSVFDGNVDVPPGTKDVDAHQVNHNIILNKKARAESMPRLVIKSHEVRSEHGATVGELDPEALFFLMARGLPENEARSLLIDGFVAEVVEQIGLPPEAGDLLEEVRGRIAGS